MENTKKLWQLDSMPELDYTNEIWYADVKSAYLEYKESEER